MPLESSHQPRMLESEEDASASLLGGGGAPWEQDLGDSPSYLWPTSGAMATKLQSMRHILVRRMNSIGSEDSSPYSDLRMGYFGNHVRRRTASSAWSSRHPSVGSSFDSVEFSSGQGGGLGGQGDSSNPRDPRAAAPPLPPPRTIPVSLPQHPEDEFLDDISLSDPNEQLLASMGGCCEGVERLSVVDSELTLNAFNNASPPKIETLSHCCTQLAKCIAVVREMVQT